VPPEAVFVDDLERNVRAAAALGIIGVHHRTYSETILELEALFEIDLGAESPLDAPLGGD
jgi:putative hydrolase of the HAD superfamily